MVITVAIAKAGGLKRTRRVMYSKHETLKQVAMKAWHEQQCEDMRRGGSIEDEDEVLLLDGGEVAQQAESAARDQMSMEQYEEEMAAEDVGGP